MQTEIDKVLEKYNQDNKLVTEYQSGNFKNSQSVKDLQMRFCFDIMYGAGLQSLHKYSRGLIQWLYLCNSS